MTSNFDKVSVVLPCFYEDKNIIPLLNEFNFLKQNSNIDFEIIIVNDSPSDGLNEKAKYFLENTSFQYKLIENYERQGLANSIKQGILSSSCSSIIVMDTDLTHNPTDIPKMVQVARVFDLVIASRFCFGGGMESLKLYYSSYFINLIIRILSKTQIQDNTGGFFLIKRDVVNQLSIDETFTGFGEYFIKLLKICQTKNIDIIEIPSKYRNRHDGNKKSNRFKMIISYALTAVKIRYS